VSSTGPRRADVLSDGDRIAAVDPRIEHPTAAIEDADGLLLFPGLIDPHTHLRQPGGEQKEDFYTGTCAALAGGVTSVFAMPNTSPAAVDAASLDAILGLAEQNAVCDYGLFLGATANNAGLKREHPALRECGLKIYMGSSTGDLLVEDFGQQYEHFAQYPPERVIAVHAEHEPAVRFFAQRGLRRPPICAELEAGRAVALAEFCNRRLHVCHVSTRREVEIIAAAKARGVPVTCEFTPHHLFLTADAPDDGGPKAEGDSAASASRLPQAFYEMNPPLRGHADIDALWASLAVADCIATDHAPHTVDEKRSARVPMGVPGLETMLPLLLTLALGARPGEMGDHGYVPGAAALRLEDIARLCCEGPARAYDIARKGRIAPGFDADITLVDPRAEWTIGERPLHTKCGWTPFAGWRVRGAVKHVFLRGRLAFDGDRVLLERGTGKRIGDA
jgi:dihydroorotase (multifunctional complex type)